MKFEEWQQLPKEEKEKIEFEQYNNYSYTPSFVNLITVVLLLKTYAIITLTAIMFLVSYNSDKYEYLLTDFLIPELRFIMILSLTFVALLLFDVFRMIRHWYEEYKLKKRYLE